MNYLVIEGYKDAAEKFSSEAGIPPQVDLSSIEDRMKIRHAVQGMFIFNSFRRASHSQIRDAKYFSMHLS
jgi:hypothetical protein